MITRRRGRATNNATMHPLQVEAVDAVDAVDVHRPSECRPADSGGGTTLDELNDLFGIEDLEWTLDRDSSSPLFDIEFAELDVYNTKGNNQELEASTTTSPDRMSSLSEVKIGPNQPSHLMNKNAVAARLNRLKKKEYVSSLEKKVGNMVTENGTLRQENAQLTKRVEELEDETRYLRAVLANESMLAQILSRLSGVNGMKLSSSLFQGPSSNDHDYALPRKRVKMEEKETSGGVCLHVDQNHVSVEFCTKCAEKASTSLQM